MPSNDARNMNERALIAEVFAPLAAGNPGAFDLKDDAACITPPPGHDLIVTTDAIIAGVHFLSDDPADAIAAKALRVNLSDLAAKGAVPLGYTLTLSLSDDVDFDWIEKFAAGLKADQDTYNIALFGGDTVRGPGPLHISITAFGTVKTGQMVRRAGAQAGDVIYASGTIGDAALGLLVVTDSPKLAPIVIPQEQSQSLVQRYRYPQPRCALVPAVSQYASAAMDVSDGLLGDIEALILASGVGADVKLAQVPLSVAARNLVECDTNLLEHVVTGGDDFEIICTVPLKHMNDFEDLARRTGVAVAPIGVITDGPNLRALNESGQEVAFSTLRYEH